MKLNIENEEISLKIPATIANIVCGFDILGMAVNEPFDDIKIKISEKPGIQIKHTDPYGLPEDPKKNVAGVALQALMNEMDEPPGFSISIHKNILPGSGLGSSGASALGTVAAANILLGKPFSHEQLIRFGMEGERAASGTAHADNVAPCLYGGITLISSEPALQINTLPYPELFVVILHPQIEVKTSDSRKIIKKEIQLKTAVRQWGYIAGLVAGFCKKDIELIRRSLNDVVFEPARSLLIPKFKELKSAAIGAEALGGGISGSGPAVFMLCDQMSVAENVKEKMNEIYTKSGIDFKTYLTTIKSTPLL